MPLQSAGGYLSGSAILCFSSLDEDKKKVDKIL